MNIIGITPTSNLYKSYNSNPLFGANTQKELEYAAYIVEKRAIFLPKVMDNLVADSASYVKEQPKDSKEFAKNYLKSSTALFKRAEAGLNHKEYSNSYKPELNLIGKISRACKQLISNIFNENNLKDTVNEAVMEYSKTPIKRTKSFIA